MRTPAVYLLLLAEPVGAPTEVLKWQVEMYDGSPVKAELIQRSSRCKVNCGLQSCRGSIEYANLASTSVGEGSSQRELAVLGQRMWATTDFGAFRT